MADDNRTYLLYVLDAQNDIARAQFLDAKEAAIHRLYGIGGGEKILPLATGVDAEARRVTAIVLNAAETEITAITYEAERTALYTAFLTLHRGYIRYEQWGLGVLDGALVSVRNKFRDHMAQRHRGAHLIYEDKAINANAPTTDAQKVAWATTARLGPSDADLVAIVNGEARYDRAKFRALVEKLDGLTVPLTPLSDVVVDTTLWPQGVPSRVVAASPVAITASDDDLKASKYVDIYNLTYLDG